MIEEEIIEEVIEKYENEIRVLECCIATLKSNLFLEQFKKNKKESKIEKRFKDELGENLNEDDREVIKMTKDFEEASNNLKKLI